MKIFSLTLFVAIAATLLSAAAASAHVTVQPSELPASGFARIDVRVPNERDDSSTKKVAVKFPSGVYFTSYEPIPGWQVKVDNRKLAKAAQVHGEPVDSETDTVTFSTKGEGIRPGQFQDFGLSIRVPDGVGKELVFPAIQTYSSGEVVRWLGAADSDLPAARATTVANRDDPSHASGYSESDDDGTTSTPIVGWVALALGAIGVLMSGGLLLTRRRS